MNDLVFRIGELSSAKRRLLDQLIDREGLDRGMLPILPRDREAGPAPLSYSQQRLWFIDQLEPASGRYNIPSMVPLAGEFDRGALKKSLREIRRRHEILRTNFRVVDGTPVQVVSEECEVPLPELDMSRVEITQKTEHLFQTLFELARHPFDLKQDSLLRAQLVRLSNQQYVLLLVIHHIVSDGWSAGLLQHALTACYHEFRSGRPPSTPKPTLQYADYAEWQRRHLDRKALEPSLNYWKEKLANLPGLLELPTDRPRRARQTANGAMQFFDLPAPLAKRVAAFAAEQGATLFMVLLAAYKMLLFRWSHETDLVVGATVANRERDELQSLIGFFVNTLVLRTDLSDEPSFRETVNRVKQSALEAYEHQQVPFEMLVEELQPERHLSRHPLFQTLFDLQNVPTVDPPDVNASQKLTIFPAQAKFDISLSMRETKTGLSGVFEYNTDLFDHATITELITRFERLLESALAEPNRPISLVPLLTEEENRALLRSAAPIDPKPAGANRPIHELFEEQVALAPQAVALQFRDETMTYEALSRRARGLARRLQEKGIGLENRVGLCVERSFEMIVGVLGTLMAGAAYVPFDPSYPKRRLRWMLDDSQPSSIVTQTSLKDRFEDSTALIEIDEVPADDGPIEQSVVSNQLAGITYTSGSTGVPKGVLTLHRGLSNVAAAQRQCFRLGKGDCVLQFAPLSFDASTFEIMWALCSGATLRILAAEEVKPGPDLVKLIHDASVTAAVLPPSTLSALPSTELPDLRILAVAGEACTAELVNRWAPGRRFFNLYGPTEAAIWTTIQECHVGDAPPPLGQSISNVQVHILDDKLQLVPDGFAGELCIGGVGVARGYLDRRELTADRFVIHPWPEIGRIYRTGDRVRRHSDRGLEFLGRLDQQIKLRGFRVEPGEIEAALVGHPEVQEAAVVATSKESARSQLIAFWVGSDATSADDLTEYLRNRLPSHLVPSQLAQVESIPRLANGKLDRNSLPVPEAIQFKVKKHYEQPETAVELELVEIWADLLCVERVGRKDGFFELGGHSLLVARFVTQVQETFGVELSVAEVFEAPQLFELAAVIEKALASPRGSPTTIAGDSDPAVFLARIDELPEGEVDRLLLELAAAENMEHVLESSLDKASANGNASMAGGRDWKELLDQVDNLPDGEIDKLLSELMTKNEEIEQ